MASVAHFITGHEQTRLNRFCYFLFVGVFLASHYENTPIVYIAVFHGCKKGDFQMKNYDIFLIFAQNIDRGYTMRRF